MKKSSPSAIVAFMPLRTNTSITSAIFCGVSKRSLMKRSLAALVCEWPRNQLDPISMRGIETPATSVRGKSDILKTPGGRLR